MALFSYHQHSSLVVLAFVLFLVLKGVFGATFSFVNACNDTVWPGITGPRSGESTVIELTGFELTKGTSRSFQAPTGWSGRFWARTDCKFDDSGHGNCTTGDCGSGEINCNGAQPVPPANFAEFTLVNGSSDFYDVSLVDGYNMPMMVEARGGSGSCGAISCGADLYRRCPPELRVDGADACKSACDAFKLPQYCCTGAFSNPSTCKPSMYSQIFKSACPTSYSYAFDDASSMFTCTGANYTITFCPSSSSPSLKPSTDSFPNSTDSFPNSTDSSPNSTDSYSGSGSDSSVDQAALASTISWLANLTKGASTRSQPFAASKSTFFVAVTFILCLLVAH